VGGEGFEPPKAHANGFTVRPGSPTPASAQNNAKIKASDKYIFIQTKMQIFYIITDYAINRLYNFPVIITDTKMYRLKFVLSI
jgi:hypothetical protein